MERAELSETQAIDIASRRCVTWGYAGTEAFGGTTRQCNQFGGLGGACAQWMVTKEFQCTGTGGATGSMSASPLAPATQVESMSILPKASPAPEAPSKTSGGAYEAALRYAAERGCSADGVSLVSGNVYRASCPSTGRSLIIQCQGQTCKEVN
ncbi:hypothetical protein J7J64_10475 [Lysobacter sp. ISL-42]|nr:hypothetical protein [Lysobacter sp. ISL-42]MBT2750681.1 hypothetical protein [Lysobacter sp. ISL-50]MBT2779510.1 hypothetical protein [Lysobacter sp. ISL-54]MBT2784654.1 hypothetical protein [Lysobacter sp. ISL-52]